MPKHVRPLHTPGLAPKLSCHPRLRAAGHAQRQAPGLRSRKVCRDQLVWASAFSISTAAGTVRIRGRDGARAQVVLGRSKKDPNKYAALKVVYLQSPQVVDDPEHMAIMKRCARSRALHADFQAMCKRRELGAVLWAAGVTLQGSRWRRASHNQALV